MKVQEFAKRYNFERMMTTKKSDLETLANTLVRFAERMARKFERSPESRAFTEMFTAPRIARMLTDKANNMVSKIADEVMAKRNGETRNDRYRYNNYQNGESIVRCLVLAEVCRRMGGDGDEE